MVRGFNRSVVVLWLLTWALAAFGYFGLQGVLFNLYLLRLGFGPEFIGLLIVASATGPHQRCARFSNRKVDSAIAWLSALAGADATSQLEFGRGNR
jgi:hypothetical protein